MTEADQACGSALAGQLRAGAGEKATRAVQDLVTEFGGRTILGVRSRTLAETDASAVDPEPIAYLEAARELERAVHALQLGHIRVAREAGRSWYEIGYGLDLHWNAVVSKESIADEAYHFARRYDVLPGRRPFTWTCLSCQQTIIDNGPWPDPPTQEEGHADNCARRAARLAGWQKYRSAR